MPAANKDVLHGCTLYLQGTRDEGEHDHEANLSAKTLLIEDLRTCKKDQSVSFQISYSYS